MGCIDEDLSVRFVRGLLAPAKAQAIDEHAACCTECRQLIADAAAEAMSESASGAVTLDGISSRRFSGSGNTTSARGNTLMAINGVAPAAPYPRLPPSLRETYRLGPCLGKGGMGAVYEASHSRLPRRFAIKFLADIGQDSDVAFRRLQREAQLASSLRHPNIVDILDFNDNPGGQPLIVMELLEGESVADRIRRQGPMSLAEVSMIVQATASALIAAHARDIVHRDVKPSNIFLCGAVSSVAAVKLLDFGLSKAADELAFQAVTDSGLGADGPLARSTDASLTHTGLVLGSPRYMSPEQASGQSLVADRRSDIFSLGATIYRMLCAEHPFDGESVDSILFHVAFDEPRATLAWARVPEPVRAVVTRAVRKDPRARHQSVQQFWQEFAAAVRKCGVLVPNDPAANLSTRDAQPREGGLSPRWKGWLWFAPIPLALAIAGWLTLRQSASGRLSTQPTPPRTHGSQPPSAPRQPRRIVAEPLNLPPPVRRNRRPRPTSTISYGSLFVQSRSAADGKPLWANVYVDGKKVGQTALTLARLAQGHHWVEVRRSGYQSQRRRIWVKRHARTRVSFELREAHANGSDQ